MKHNPLILHERFCHLAFFYIHVDVEGSFKLSLVKHIQLRGKYLSYKVSMHYPHLFNNVNTGNIVIMIGRTLIP